MDYQHNVTCRIFLSCSVTCFPWTINTTHHLPNIPLMLSPTGVFQGLSTQLITCRIFLSCCHLQVFSKDYQHNVTCRIFLSCCHLQVFSKDYQHNVTCRIFLSCCHLQVFSKDYQHNSSPAEYSSHAVTYRCFPRTINTIRQTLNIPSTLCHF